MTPRERPYCLCEDPSPPVGGQLLAASVRVSGACDGELVVLRMIGADGFEVHWPMSVTEAMALADALVVKAVPFVPSRCHG